MKKRRFYLDFGVFRRYFVSLIGFLLITFCLIGTFIINRSAHSMWEDVVRTTENKLSYIVEDVESQMDIMRKIAIEIAVLPEFRLEDILQNKYNEIQMLEQFERYGYANDMMESYFIKYYSYDNVFTSSKTIMPSELYLREKLKMEECTEAMEMIQELSINSEESCIVYQKAGKILFMYPMKKNVVGKYGENAILVFYLTHSEFEQRMARVVGKINGDISIFYKDVCIYGEKTQYQSDEMSLISKRGNITAYFRIDEENYFSWNKILSGNDLAILGAIVAIMMVIAYVFSVWNYKPIDKILSKFNLLSKNSKVNWNDIEALIDNLLHERERDGKLLTRQYHIIRESVIYMLMRDGCSNKVQNLLVLLNINIDVPFWGVVQCISSNHIKEINFNDELYQAIVDLSGDTFELYPYRDYDGGLRILCAAEEEYYLSEILELLESLFRILDLDINVEICSKGCSLKEMIDLLQEKNISVCEVDCRLLEEKEQKKNSSKRQKMVSQVMEYIRVHSTEYNMSLGRVAEEFQVSPVYLSKIIKAEVGKGYTDYLIELRMNEAERLLSEEDINVAEVCQRVGYLKVSYFIKIFQKYTGETPAKYKERRKESR